MRQAQDSMSYYRLMGLYGKTFFISSDFDSILYYNRPVKEYDKCAAACPRWNDVLSDVYNIEGNVWMQLNQPDSAVAYYEKSYAYRLKGEKGHLLSDICMNLADAHLHRGELAHTASYYRRALFICDSRICRNIPNFRSIADWDRLTWICVILICPIIITNWQDSFLMK